MPISIGSILLERMKFPFVSLSIDKIAGTSISSPKNALIGLPAAKTKNPARYRI